MNTTFSFNRLALLFKRYFTESRQYELSFWGIVIVIFMIIHQKATVEIYMYISGFIFAARMFKVFLYTPGGMHYLLIPATHTEKLVVNIILSTFYYFAMILITYTIGSFLGTLLGNLILSTNNPVTLDLFNSATVSGSWYNHADNSLGLWDIFLTFALLQSVFMLGSIYFKGNAIGKTFLTFIALAFFFGVLELLLVRITFGAFHLDRHNLNLSVSSGEELSSAFKTAMEIFKYALIPFFWLVSYFRLTEKQV